MKKNQSQENKYQTASSWECGKVKLKITQKSIDCLIDELSVRQSYNGIWFSSNTHKVKYIENVTVESRTKYSIVF